MKPPLKRPIAFKGKPRQVARGECATMAECPKDNDATMPVPPELMSAVRTLGLLSASARGIVLTLLEQMAEREGVTMTSGENSLPSPADGLDLWQSKMRQEGKSYRTVDTYLSTLRRFLAEHPAPTKLDIQKWLAQQLETKSASAVANHRKALRSLFGFLHEEGLWPMDPTARLGSIKVSHRAKDPPTIEETMKLLTYECWTKAQTKKYRLFTLLLMTTALRITEAASLRKDRVYLDRHEIRVVGKGDKERVVPLVPVTEQELALYLQDNPNESPYCFPGDTKLGWWSIASYEKTLRRACVVLGLKHFTPHSLRHFYATYALKGGAKLEVVSRILGHASVAITADLYRHVLTDEIHDTSRQFAPLTNVKRIGMGEGGTVNGEFHEVTDGDEQTDG